MSTIYQDIKGVYDLAVGLPCSNIPFGDHWNLDGMLSESLAIGDYQTCTLGSRNRKHVPLLPASDKHWAIWNALPIGQKLFISLGE